MNIHFFFFKYKYFKYIDDLRDVGYIVNNIYLTNVEMFIFYKNLFVQQNLIFINQRLQNLFTEYQRIVKLKLYSYHLKEKEENLKNKK